MLYQIKIKPIKLLLYFNLGITFFLQWSIIKYEQASEDNSITCYTPVPKLLPIDLVIFDFDRQLHSISFLNTILLSFKFKSWINYHEWFTKHHIQPPIPIIRVYLTLNMYNSFCPTLYLYPKHGKLEVNNFVDGFLHGLHIYTFRFPYRCVGVKKEEFWK